DEDACRSYENLINPSRTSLVLNDETDVTAKSVRRARFPCQSPATLLTSYRQPLNKEDEQCTESRSDKVANRVRADQSAKIEQAHKWNVSPLGWRDGGSDARGECPMSVGTICADRHIRPLRPRRKCLFPLPLC